VALTTHPPSTAEVKESVELYVYSPHRAFVTCTRANFTFYFVSFGWIFRSSVGGVAWKYVVFCLILIASKDGSNKRYQVQ
jgi:hypothetical protein